MATTSRTSTDREVEYPTSDGKPMAETDIHRQDMVDLIDELQYRFAADPNVYVTGNLLLFYERGNRRRHVSPDVFVVRGVPKLPPRKYYLLWEEGRGPDVVIELTSKTTRRNDQTKKPALYRDVLKVQEYFQFDPTEDYLRPSMQGHRLEEGQYVPIKPIAGRLPSAVLGLHLERRGVELRLYDPATGRYLLTPKEKEEAGQRAEDARQRAEDARQRAEEARQRAEEAAQRSEAERQRAEEALHHVADAKQQVEAENERMRRELEALRGGGSGATAIKTGL